MGWAIIIIVIFIGAFWLVSRVYSKDKNTPKKDETQGIADDD